MLDNCVPRGRWLRARYVRLVSLPNQKLYIYEATSVGSGVTDIVPGELVVVISPEQVVEIGGNEAFVWRDYIIATWNPVLEIANPVSPYMRGVRVYGSTAPGNTWNSDAMILNVINTSPEVSDIALGDNVVVPMRAAWLSGPEQQGTFIFHPDHVIGKCP